MAAAEGFVELRSGRAIGWICTEMAQLGLDAFWAELQDLPGVKGRGGIGRLTLAGRELVVRPYRRGGALGSLLQDRYAGPSRARRELEVLAALRAEGVPVVVPLAAVARRPRAFWRLRLCTEWLPDSLPLPAFMAKHSGLRRFTAEAVGIVVRLAFAAGLRHTDLHMDNILCAVSGDRVRAVLVDLDRATLKKPLAQKDTDGMLARLVRYIVRHRGKLAAEPSRSEMMRFLKALGLERDARHATWRRTRKTVARAVGKKQLAKR